MVNTYQLCIDENIPLIIENKRKYRKFDFKDGAGLYKFVPKVETNKLLEYINVSKDKGDIFDKVLDSSLLDIGIK